MRNEKRLRNFCETAKRAIVVGMGETWKDLELVGGWCEMKESKNAKFVYICTRKVAFSSQQRLRRIPEGGEGGVVLYEDAPEM